MEISEEMRKKIAELDGLATEVHEYLYQIQGHQEKEQTEEQLRIRSETMDMLIDLNCQITELQEKEGWLD